MKEFFYNNFCLSHKKPYNIFANVIAQWSRIFLLKLIYFMFFNHSLYYTQVIIFEIEVRDIGLWVGLAIAIVCFMTYFWVALFCRVCYFFYLLEVCYCRVFRILTCGYHGFKVAIVFILSSYLFKCWSVSLRFRIVCQKLYLGSYLCHFTKFFRSYHLVYLLLISSSTWKEFTKFLSPST